MILDAKKVVVWGDSVARGVIYDEKRERYALSPITAAKIVSDKLGIRITNRARMGYTVSDGVKIIEHDLARGIEADTAIIEFGGNDCDFVRLLRPFTVPVPLPTSTKRTCRTLWRRFAKQASVPSL